MNVKGGARKEEGRMKNEEKKLRVRTKMFSHFFLQHFTFCIL